MSISMEERFRKRFLKMFDETFDERMTEHCKVECNITQIHFANSIFADFIALPSRVWNKIDAEKFITLPSRVWNKIDASDRVLAELAKATRIQSG